MRALLALLLFGFVVPSFAAMFIPPQPPQSQMWTIQGPIWDSDPEAFQRVVVTQIQKTPGKNFIFYLNSDGGDVGAALRLGRELRAHRATVIVAPQMRCMSACVFILAGGVDRKVWGEVGIHRPYSLVTGEKNYAQTQKAFLKRQDAVRTFLSDMNVPMALYDAMMEVPSQEIRVLSDEELRRFGLKGTDPVEREVRDSSAAAKLGLSMPDYLAKQQASYACTPYVDHQDYTGFEMCMKGIFGPNWLDALN